MEEMILIPFWNISKIKTRKKILNYHWLAQNKNSINHLKKRNLENPKQNWNMDNSNIMIKINGKTSSRILNCTKKKKKCITEMKIAPTKSIYQTHSINSDHLIRLFPRVKNKAYLKINFHIVSSQQPFLNTSPPVKLVKQQILDWA